MDRYMRSAPYSMIHVCLDDYSDHLFAGRAYNPTIEDPIVFHDINEFFLKVDELFDRNGNPMSGSVKRTFRGEAKRQNSYQRHPELCCSYESLLQYQGEVLTADLVVTTRHSVTWQGFVFYDHQTYPFKDVLEVYRIISNIISK